MQGNLLPVICAVQVPGRVENVQEAIASVGGTAAVGQAMQNREGRLRLRLCRKYHFQAPVPMRRQRTSDVLVRAKRGSDGKWSVEPIGIVDPSFRAESLADFVFVPGQEFSHGESPVIGSIEHELSADRRPTVPYMPPAFFTRVDAPQPYDFEENAFLRRYKSREFTQVAGTGEAKLRRAWITVRVYKFHETTPVPTEPPDGATAQVRDDEKSVVDALQQLFSTRPIWLRGPLEERLREQNLTANVTTMQKCLLVVSYLWGDGPWRGSYIRLGYDPRDNPEEAKQLQVLDFRDRYLRQQRSYFERIEIAQDHPAPAALDCHFRTPPVNRSQLYQLKDIEDEVVQQTVSQPAVNTISERFGWISAEAIESVRERLAVKSELMRRSQATCLALEAPPAMLALMPPRPESEAVLDDTGATETAKETGPPKKVGKKLRSYQAASEDAPAIPTDVSNKDESENQAKIIANKTSRSSSSKAKAKMRSNCKSEKHKQEVSETKAECPAAEPVADEYSEEFRPPPRRKMRKVVAESDE